MRKVFSFMMVLSLMLWNAAVITAAEHGGSAVGKEHGGTATKEHDGANAPSADAIRTAMESHVRNMSQATGTFDVLDPETGKTRKLELVRVHERVGKTGDYYYSCADFKDTETGQMLDLDLNVQDNAGALSVADVRIHKVEGKERYTYDANDNRIPINAEGSHAEGEEHGGTEHKEHGGN